MANTWVTAPLNYAAFGGELPSCDVLTGAQGDIVSSFPDVAALLRPSCGFIIVTGVSWGLGPCLVTGGCFSPLPWQSLPLHTSGTWDIPWALTAPQGQGSGGRPWKRGVRGSFPTPSTRCFVGLARFWQSFVLEESGKKIGNAAASCVTFLYQVISIFNSGTACISIFSLFITLRFVFCIVAVVFYINFA